MAVNLESRSSKTTPKVRNLEHSRDSRLQEEKKRGKILVIWERTEIKLINKVSNVECENIGMDERNKTGNLEYNAKKRWTIINTVIVQYQLHKFNPILT
ncbi:Hypothetical predicted protein [Octopus vulgaris]|uniref:Uncharacterized protein n=1 Tax=Octopus vulgaris TaxID=6645 RepID=A0AA36FFG6_OCTVU|nr:Hypothetical predicted protein [Octopus vulgaris]